MATDPDLRVEAALIAERGIALLGAIDEVGRGALAGPVSVGIVVIGPGQGDAPAGVRDSKLVPEKSRPSLIGPIRKWALDSAVGHAAAAEIDQLGLTSALRLAGLRALEQLTTLPDLVLLDGKHNWLSAGATLFDNLYTARGGAPDITTPPVVTRIKADRDCASVAAASVLAKVERDRLMQQLAGKEPYYGWMANKGYGSPLHLQAVREHGLSQYHRQTWKIQR